MNNFSEYFKNTYYQKLINPNNGNPIRNRADSLLKVFEILDNKPENHFYNIVETGCMRSQHGELNFSGDGCSSLIFHDFINKKKGTLHTIDIDSENIEYTKNVCGLNNHKYFCGDSINEIINACQFIVGGSVDLFYLDSFDIQKENPHPSALHHLMELLSASLYIKSGTIVIIDDADAFFDGGKIGKSMYVRDYMNKIGVKPIYSGYQLIYQF